MKFLISLTLILVSGLVNLNAQCVSGDCSEGFGKYIFPDKSYYEGEWKNDARNGKGTYFFIKDSTIYIGEFQNDVIHGYGILKCKSYVYEGNYQNGQWFGKGKVQYNDGRSYEGNFLYDQFDGFGVLKTSDFIYEGEFKNNSFDGVGYYHSINENYSYKGSYKRGIEDGYGELNTEDYSFKGFFKEGKYHGKGECNSKENYIFKGNFDNNLYEGYGEFINFKDSTVKKGTFVKNYLKGFGTIKKFDSTLIYQGNFEKNSFHGKGLLIIDEKSKYEGEFRYGKITGIGKYSFSNGDFYEGDFFDSKFHGQGKLIKKNGITMVGYWDNNKFVGSNPDNIVSGYSSDTDTIKLVMTESGLYELPIWINNSLNIFFIFDPGASETSISSDIVGILIKNKTITQNDFIEGREFILADGSKIFSNRLILKNLRIGNRQFDNVTAVISNNISAPLLLGQNVLNQLGKYSIDFNKGLLIIHEE